MQLKQHHEFAGKPRETGFTLVELMITLAVIAVLATVAVPNFQSLVKNNRLSSQANDLISSLNFARSEAAKRGSSVTISKLGAAGWDGGWEIKDKDGNLIRTHAAFEGTSTLTSATTTVTYKGSGFVNSASSISFDLCDDRSGETGRTIQISTTGRVSVSNKSCS